MIARTCKNGHFLEWSTKMDYPSGCYNCELCGTRGICPNGRYRCSNCSFDICQNCHSKEANDFYFCKQGHPLYWKYKEGGYTCDICKKRCISPNMKFRWKCGRCDYDVCSKCRPEPVQSGVTPVGEVTTQVFAPGNMTMTISNPNVVPSRMTAPVSSTERKCSNNHFLQWSKDSGGSPYNTYYCNVCMRTEYTIHGRWTCSICQYNKCNNCQNLPAPQTTTGCTHNFTWTQSQPGFMGSSYDCIFCRKIQSSAASYWFCSLCQRSACPTCFSQNSQDSSKCFNGHNLEWKISAYPSMTYRCTKCNRTGLPGDKGRWNCSACMYDVCNSCKSTMDFSTSAVEATSIPFISNNTPRCTSGHNFIWIPKEYPSKVYICTYCRSNYSGEMGTWNCPICRHDVCSNCTTVQVNQPTPPSPLNVVSDPWVSAGQGYPMGEFAFPTLCMGSRDPNGQGFNDYYLLIKNYLKEGRGVNIIKMEIWTNMEQNSIIYMWLKYEISNRFGPPIYYDLEHGTKPSAYTLPHYDLSLSNIDCITNIKGKYAYGKITQLRIETSKGLLIAGINEGNEFDLKVPVGKKVISIASEFTSVMKCIGAYYI